MPKGPKKFLCLALVLPISHLVKDNLIEDSLTPRTWNKLQVYIQIDVLVYQNKSNNSRDTFLKPLFFKHIWNSVRFLFNVERDELVLEA